MQLNRRRITEFNAAHGQLLQLGRGGRHQGPDQQKLVEASGVDRLGKALRQFLSPRIGAHRPVKDHEQVIRDRSELVGVDLSELPHLF